MILTNDKTSAVDESGKGLVVSILLMVLGILLLISACKNWQKEDDPDAPPPKWQSMIGGLTPLKTFGLGFVHLLINAKFWVFSLGAIGVIAEAQPGHPGSATAYLLFVLLAESLLVAPLLIQLILPGRAESLIGSFAAWLTTYSRQIVIAISLIFGLAFFYQGVRGLLG